MKKRELSRRNLLKALRALGKVDDGEALAAARKATELLDAAGLDWLDILKPDREMPTKPKEPKPARSTRPVSPGRARTAAAIWQGYTRQAHLAPSENWCGCDECTGRPGKVEFALRSNAEFSDWEVGFLESLIGWNKPITEKQSNVLDRLFEAALAAAEVTEAAQ